MDLTRDQAGAKRRRKAAPYVRRIIVGRLDQLRGRLATRRSREDVLSILAGIAALEDLLGEVGGR